MYSLESNTIPNLQCLTKETRIEDIFGFVSFGYAFYYLACGLRIVKTMLKNTLQLIGNTVIVDDKSF